MKCARLAALLHATLSFLIFVASFSTFACHCWQFDSVVLFGIRDEVILRPVYFPFDPTRLWAGSASSPQITCQCTGTEETQCTGEETPCATSPDHTTESTCSDTGHAEASDAETDDAETDDAETDDAETNDAETDDPEVTNPEASDAEPNYTGASDAEARYAIEAEIGHRVKGSQGETKACDAKAVL
jgi:hypothetical protein